MAKEDPMPVTARIRIEQRGKFGRLLAPHDGAELFFGLVAPAGTDVEKVCAVLRGALEEVDYATEIVPLSSLIAGVLNDTERTTEDFRIRRLMAEGTELREASGRGDMVALLGISAIRQIREDHHKARGDRGKQLADKPLPRTAYIFRSLKTPAEVETLRLVYGQAFNLISIYSSESERLDGLARRIASSYRRSDPSHYKEIAQQLIRIDREDDKDLGQQVRRAFPLADFFLTYGKQADMRRATSRFIRLLFGHPFITPTRDEYSMFLAQAVSLRSADLARQIGAAITSKEGELLSVGCNEVPKFGGGQYWEGDSLDHRDFVAGEDASATNKKQTLVELLDRLSRAGWLNKKAASEGPEQLVQDILIGTKKDLFKQSQALSIIEFGRSVHAEMAAISDAAKRGVRVSGATLFTSTFPCHICARHIVAVGVQRVVYVEPYPKSKADELYSDSIEINPESAVERKVAFEPFVGVAPRKYLHVFEQAGERKDALGKAVDWESMRRKKNPRFKRFVLSYTLIEQRLLDEIVEPFLQAIEGHIEWGAHGEEMEFKTAGRTSKAKRKRMA